VTPTDQVLGNEYRNLETPQQECNDADDDYYDATASRPAVGPTQRPINWVPGALSMGVKKLGHEADHSLRSCVEFKNVWNYTATLPYVFTAWCVIKQETRLHGGVLS
jgi:hypothetical protein